MPFPGALTGFPTAAVAGENVLGVTSSPLAWACIAIFVLAYCVVMAEEQLHLRKSKPVIMAAGIIWALIAFLAAQKGVHHEELKQAVIHDLEEFLCWLKASKGKASPAMGNQILKQKLDG